MFEVKLKAEADEEGAWIVNVDEINNIEGLSKVRSLNGVREEGGKGDKNMRGTAGERAVCRGSYRQRRTATSHGSSAS